MGDHERGRPYHGQSGSYDSYKPRRFDHQRSDRDRDSSDTSSLPSYDRDRDRYRERDHDRGYGRDYDRDYDRGPPAGAAARGRPDDVYADRGPDHRLPPRNPTWTKPGYVPPKSRPSDHADSKGGHDDSTKEGAPRPTVHPDRRDSIALTENQRPAPAVDDDGDVNMASVGSNSAPRPSAKSFSIPSEPKQPPMINTNVEPDPMAHQSKTASPSSKITIAPLSKPSYANTLHHLPSTGSPLDPRLRLGKVAPSVSSPQSPATHPSPVTPGFAPAPGPSPFATHVTSIIDHLVSAASNAHYHELGQSMQQKRRADHDNWVQVRLGQFDAFVDQDNQELQQVDQQLHKVKVDEKKSRAAAHASLLQLVTAVTAAQTQPKPAVSSEDFQKLQSVVGHQGRELADLRDKSLQNGQYETIKKELNELRDEFCKFLQLSHTQRNTDEAKSDGISKKFQDLDDRLQSLDRQTTEKVEAAAHQSIDVRKDIATLRSDSETMRTDLGKLQSDVAPMAGRIYALDMQIQEAVKKVDSMKSIFDILEKSADDFEAKRKAFNDRFEEVERNWRSDFDSIRTQMSVSSADDRAPDRHDALNARVKGLEDAQHKIQDAQHKIQDAQHKIKDAAKYHLNEVEKMKDSVESLQELKQIAADLQKRLGELETRFAPTEGGTAHGNTGPVPSSDHQDGQSSAVVQATSSLAGNGSTAAAPLQQVSDLQASVQTLWKRLDNTAQHLLNLLNPLIIPVRDRLPALEAYVLNHDARLRSMTLEPFIQSIVQQMRVMYPSPDDVARRLQSQQDAQAQIWQVLNPLQVSATNLKNRVRAAEAELQSLRAPKKLATVDRAGSFSAPNGVSSPTMPPPNHPAWQTGTLTTHEAAPERTSSPASVNGQRRSSADFAGPNMSSPRPANGFQTEGAGAGGAPVRFNDLRERQDVVEHRLTQCERELKAIKADMDGCQQKIGVQEHMLTDGLARIRDAAAPPPPAPTVNGPDHAGARQQRRKLAEQQAQLEAVATKRHADHGAHLARLDTGLSRLESGLGDQQASLTELEQDLRKDLANNVRDQETAVQNVQGTLGGTLDKHTCAHAEHRQRFTRLEDDARAVRARLDAMEAALPAERKEGHKKNSDKSNDKSNGQSEEREEARQEQGLRGDVQALRTRMRELETGTLGEFSHLTFRMQMLEEFRSYMEKAEREPHSSGPGSVATSQAAAAAPSAAEAATPYTQARGALPHHPAPEASMRRGTPLAALSARPNSQSSPRQSSPRTPKKRKLEGRNWDAIKKRAPSQHRGASASAAASATPSQEPDEQPTPLRRDKSRKRGRKTVADSDDENDLSYAP